jgi:hypothetical protein
MVGRGVRADRADGASSVGDLGTSPAAQASSGRGTSGQAAARVGAAESARRRVRAKRPDREEPEGHKLSRLGKTRSREACCHGRSAGAEPAAVEEARGGGRTPRWSAWRRHTPTPARPSRLRRLPRLPRRARWHRVFRGADHACATAAG